MCVLDLIASVILKGFALFLLQQHNQKKLL